MRTIQLLFLAVFIHSSYSQNLNYWGSLGFGAGDSNQDVTFTYWEATANLSVNYLHWQNSIAYTDALNSAGNSSGTQGYPNRVVVKNLLGIMFPFKKAAISIHTGTVFKKEVAEKFKEVYTEKDEWKFGFPFNLMFMREINKNYGLEAGLSSSFSSGWHNIDFMFRFVFGKLPFLSQ